MSIIKQHLGYAIDIDGFYSLFNKDGSAFDDPRYSNFNTWVIMDSPQKGCKSEFFVYKTPEGQWIQPDHITNDIDTSNLIKGYLGPQIRHVKFDVMKYIKHVDPLIQLIEQDKYCKGIDGFKFCFNCRHQMNYNRMKDYTETLIQLTQPETKTLDPNDCHDLLHLFFSRGY